ncbi:hypothetical protein GCM10010168_74530 [Actinoplanes ianthinogenes]|uniref:DUF2231 domain-containing protein n=1 Tax=Actinoplanes ianthinogenes TaxID=122358 RepID=A0ABM7LR79_9ACTN|nr:hypothetical protein [Actinoplanes ianthinogenes]BCJ41765.1 hypothetical protein Aiant_24220 [Actinoplanes ianthinogenes]GGR44788.1 hypothetical protein GCM10010168_74530 [Actinoplanes ianthinogenes]
MRCDTCDTELTHAGQGHVCRSATAVPDGPPAAWTRATRALLGLLGAVLVTDLVNGALRLAGAGYPVLLATGLLWIAAVAGTIGALIVWNNRTRQLAEAYSADQNTYVWSLGWRLVILVPMLTAILTMGRDSTDGDNVTVFGLALRAVLVLGATGGVLLSRARVRRLVRDSLTAQRSG